MRDFIKLFNILNNQKVDIASYGVETNRIQVINGEMIFYKSFDNGLDKFVVTYIMGKIQEITFFFNKKNISLKDFKEMFGEYTSAYNFRDNITSLFFLKYNGYNMINNIRIEYEGNFNALNDYTIRSVVIKMNENGI